MSKKITAASIERDFPAARQRFKDQAAQVKEAHHAARKAIQDDPMTSDLAKRGKLDALKAETRSKLDALRSEQDAYVKNLRDQVEKEFRGSRPTDANSVLLRRDASDRARRIIEQQDALDVLRDAIANDDADLAHAVGNRARHTGMTRVVEEYTAAYPDTADSAQALSYLDANASGAAWNLDNGITFAAPLD
ncbi:hypothetical protein [Microbacterium oxydans]|uniref:hypothetical protein n=1 Tax=Microbacterium oxydans TaxID=82380 RepID=UPI0022B1EFE6|nr:hypothetical protein [Microbacterium oxydans]MCZ4301342.1 hypothetical protein [Microbacterium oxydans]